MDLDDLVKSSAAVVTVTEAAELLGVDARTISRAMANGDLPALRVGRRLLIPRLPLLAHLGVLDARQATTPGALAS
jgi:excisionase family DNA binding protein